MLYIFAMSLHFPEMLKIPRGKPLMDATHPLDPFELDNTTELQKHQGHKAGIPFIG